MNALELSHVGKRLGEFELKDVSLTLPDGCIMGLIGENGAGKSTTIKTVLGLMRMDSGEIRILGKPVAELDAVKEQIGVVMDECCFHEVLTATDVSAVLKNVYRAWDAAQFAALCQKFALPARQKIKEYSRGMKMKLSIAVALSHGARLLILDEATSGLDPVVRDEVLDIFLEFIQDEGHSVLISSHIISDLEKICDYITFIHKGKILMSEPKDELLERYGILKCTEAELVALDAAAVQAVRRSRFGVEALVLRNRVPRAFTLDRASMEDIMLFSIKEEKLS